MPLTIFVLLLLLPARVVGEVAFGAPGIPFSWATSKKQGVGTAYEAYGPGRDFAGSPTAPLSRVWFTLARGILTETFYPRIDRAQSRDTQILVTDGETFLHEEQYQLVHQVDRIPGAPLFLVSNRDPGGRYTILKEIWADPGSDTVVQRLRIERHVAGLRFFVLHKPAAANTLFNDDGESAPLVAGEEGQWQGLGSVPPFVKTSVGYVGFSDGYADLRDLRLDFLFTRAPRGNVAMTGELPVPPTEGVSELVLFLFFAPTREEVSRRHVSLAAFDVAESRERYAADWGSYLAGLDLPPSPDPMLVETSALVLKSSEDKTFPGAIVASPSHPWGEQQVETAGTGGIQAGYHVVWPRDLYHTAMGLLAVGDEETSVAILDNLVRAQFDTSDGFWELGPRRRPKAGSFPQNYWVDGTALYGGYQADQTAMPVLLAYRLWKLGAISVRRYYPMIVAAAEFLAGMGPWTQTERWEESYGISPNSAAYAISALVTASEMAIAVGDADFGSRILGYADAWAMKPGDNVDDWTFTHRGKIASGNGWYYLRLDGAASDKAQDGAVIWDAPWDPNDDGWVKLANHQGDDRFRWESEIVDGSFLALVRLGVRAATHPAVLDTLPELDECLRRDTTRGPGWYRYRFDGYGEGSRGRLWPLLTGERLHYELRKLIEEGNPAPGKALEAAIRAYGRFASREGIFSEQVWDEGSAAGTPTDSASPLAWAHAEYLELARSLHANEVFEEIPAVRARYGTNSGASEDPLPRTSDLSRR